MATPPKLPQQTNKAVVAFLDGRRLKGYLFDFSPTKDWFNLAPPENPLQGQRTKVLLNDLKAVFFVKDFAGDAKRDEPSTVPDAVHGRKIEVIFRDGEMLRGKTEGYNPQKLGFFMMSGSNQSNNIRVFVVNKNVKQVRFI